MKTLIWTIRLNLTEFGGHEENLEFRTTQLVDFQLNYKGTQWSQISYMKARMISINSLLQKLTKYDLELWKSGYYNNYEN